MIKDNFIYIASVDDRVLEICIDLANNIEYNFDLRFNRDSFAKQVVSYYIGYIEAQADAAAKIADAIHIKIGPLELQNTASTDMERAPQWVVSARLLAGPLTGMVVAIAGVVALAMVLDLFR